MGAARKLGEYFCALNSAAGHDPLQWPRQAARIAHARTRYGISPFFYSLNDLKNVPEARWFEFVLEDEFDRIARRLNPRAARKIAFDKLMFHEHCVRHGLPTMPILGIINSDVPEALRHLHIPNADALDDFLTRHPGPLFFKRIDGSKGQGAFAVGRTAEEIRFDGRVGTADELFAACQDHRRSWAHGTSRYLIQPFIRVDPALAPIMSPSGVGTLRAITTMTGGNPRIVFLFMKMTVGDNTTDNFVFGTTGNLVSGVDEDSGALTDAIRSKSRRWPEIVQVTHHPDTGEKIGGFVLPRWREMRDLILRATATLPALGLIGWDAAFTAEGPILLESNVQPTIYLLQLVAKRGLRRELYTALGGQISDDELRKLRHGPYTGDHLP